MSTLNILIGVPSIHFYSAEEAKYRELTPTTGKVTITEEWSKTNLNHKILTIVLLSFPSKQLREGRHYDLQIIDPPDSMGNQGIKNIKDACFTSYCKKSETNTATIHTLTFTYLTANESSKVE